MPKKNKIFKECFNKVPKSMLATLTKCGFINAENRSHSWAYMSKYLMKDLITNKEAKYLVILEMNRTDGVAPRIDLIERFVRYINRADKEEVLTAIKKELKK